MKKIFLGLMACAALCACTSDDVLVNNLTNSEVKDGLYMQFKLEMPSTRSATEEPVDDYVTSSDGIEYGKDYENNVQTLMVVLTDENNNYITKAKKYSGSSSTYYVATFEAAEIEDYATKKVEVHVYCNTPESFEGKNVDAIYEGEPETAWKENAFFMSNAKELEVELPEDFTPYKDISTPYSIGTVYVERSVARMDYKDGSDGDFTYPMMVDEISEEAQINLVISEMALINMSNSFYYLRHMAASTDNSEYNTANLNEITLLTPETDLNWVIDTDADDKINYEGDDLSDNFTYPLQHPGEWDWTKMEELGDEDNDETWNEGGSYGDYNIWRYLTENTIPSIEAQLNGITTGVVFKAQIVPTENCEAELAEAFNSGERIFAYANEIVGTWEMVADFAEANPYTALAAAYNNVMGQVTETSTAAELSAAQAAEGFTGYSPADDGNYYCYYYYWNRHNDNLHNGVMGTMEFDVVRNNVYKLSVTGISLFGHPTPTDSTEPNEDPDPDPDPVNPDDPDEDNNIYIQVTVEILPWVVRVNDITF